jgi:hypothetical protein
MLIKNKTKQKKKSLLPFPEWGQETFLSLSSPPYLVCTLSSYTKINPCWGGEKIFLPDQRWNESNHEYIGVKCHSYSQGWPDLGVFHVSATHGIISMVSATSLEPLHMMFSFKLIPGVEVGRRWPTQCIYMWVNVKTIKFKKYINSFFFLKLAL